MVRHSLPAVVDQFKPFPGQRVNDRSCRNLPFPFH